MNKSTYEDLEKLGIVQSQECSKEEFEKIPEKLRAYGDLSMTSGSYGRYPSEKDLDMNSILIELSAKQTLYLKTVKSILTAFTWIFVISVLICFVMLNM